VPESIGIRRVSCSAVRHDMLTQCRCYKNLTAVAVKPMPTGGSGIDLPSFVVILLCPKHLKFRSRPPLEG
jgi:hypothetical protein